MTLKMQKISQFRKSPGDILDTLILIILFYKKTIKEDNIVWNENNV